MKINVLLIEDSATSAFLIRKMLNYRQKGHWLAPSFEITHVKSLSAGLTYLIEQNVDIVLLDLSLPDSTGLETFNRVYHQVPEIPIIILTSDDDEMVAIKTMQTGAQDYLIKEQTDGSLLKRAIRYAIERHGLITDLEKHMRHLLSSEMRFRHIIERNVAGVLIVDQLGVVRFANPAAERIFGCSEVALLEKPLEFSIRTHEPTEVRIARPDKTIGIVEMHVVETIWEGEQVYLASLHDITDRKHLEDNLQQERASLAKRVQDQTAHLIAANAELARAAQLKDEFLAGISHELRTPLNAVLGVVESLQEQIYGPLNKKQIQLLRHLEESGRHLLQLINDILDVAKVEAGKLNLTWSSVSIEEVCQASLQLVREEATKKGLRMSTIFPSAVEMIQADERRLKQILVNLLSNAVKFTRAGGTIGLEIVNAPEHIQFTVWDTGIGIAEQDMNRLFQPFVQLDSSLARSYSGTGLGLSLVHRLVELHGGHVTVESELDKGSRFTVSLPWGGPLTELPNTQSAVQNQFAPASLTERLRLKQTPLSTSSLLTEQKFYLPPSARILLVEDSEQNIITLSDYLTFKNFDVIVARNGLEAIEQAKALRPDLILMDIQMPKMDGLEATRRLRANADLQSIPIIALTALAMPGDQEQCYEAGVDDYLSKPISLKKLVTKIETYLKP